MLQTSAPALPFNRLPNEIILYILDFYEFAFDLEAYISKCQQVMNPTNSIKSANLVPLQPTPHLKMLYGRFAHDFYRKPFLVFPNVNYLERGVGNVRISQYSFSDTRFLHALEHLVPWKHIKRVVFPQIHTILTQHKKSLKILTLSDDSWVNLPSLKAALVSLRIKHVCNTIDIKHLGWNK